MNAVLNPNLLTFHNGKVPVWLVSPCEWTGDCLARADLSLFGLSLVLELNYEGRGGGKLLGGVMVWLLDRFVFGQGTGRELCWSECILNSSEGGSVLPMAFICQAIQVGTGAILFY